MKTPADFKLTTSAVINEAIFYLKVEASDSAALSLAARHARHALVQTAQDRRTSDQRIACMTIADAEQALAAALISAARIYYQNTVDTARRIGMKIPQVKIGRQRGRPSARIGQTMLPPADDNAVIDYAILTQRTYSDRMRIELRELDTLIGDWRTVLQLPSAALLRRQIAAEIDYRTQASEAYQQAVSAIDHVLTLF